MLRILITALVLGGWGCRPEPPAGSTPREALTRLAPCVDRSDGSCLFRELDRDSRWSVETIHRSLLEARSLVERSYPEHSRAGALGTWEEASRSATPAEAFAALAGQRGWSGLVAAGFGAAVDVRETGPDEAEVETTRGVSLPFAARDGRWGLALWREDLQRDKLRALDILEQIRKNALEFDLRRAALEGAPSGEKSADAI